MVLEMNDIIGQLYFKEIIEINSSIQHIFHRYFEVTEVFEVNSDTMNVCVREVGCIKRYIKKDNIRFNDVINRTVKESIYYTKPISNDYLSDQAFSILINIKEPCSSFILDGAILKQVPKSNELYNAIEFQNIHQKII